MQVGNRLAQLVLVNLFLTPVAAPGDAFKKEIGALETENMPLFYKLNSRESPVFLEYKNFLS